MTKEQFIKRVEEITGHRLYFCSDIIFYFIYKEETETALRIGEYGIAYTYKCWGKNIPCKWLIPLGEAIKEYYEWTNI